LNNSRCAFTHICIALLFIQSLPFITAKWSAEFQPKNITIHMHTTAPINLTITGLDSLNLRNATIFLQSDVDIINVNKTIDVKDIVNGQWTGQFQIDAIFLGSGTVFVVIGQNGVVNRSEEYLPVVIIREVRFIDSLFTISVASLVSILYINFGAALDLKKVRGIVFKPVGPAIGIFCQFLFMPLTSYFLGLWLFPKSVEMQLGLFFTGISPAGGASNIWTVVLGGNLDLSIAMTTISTFASFGMIPLWTFTLGRTIFDRGNLVVPYSKIATFAFGLLIPLGIGVLIQKYYPRMAAVLVRILKTFSSLLILFIVIFAIITNLYLFELFTWEIVIGGLALPLLGYFAGWLLSIIFQQEKADRLAIAIEAGIQNTGIAIFILRFALGQPQADLTTVIPVSVAIMTPLPLIGFYFCLKIRNCISRRRNGAIPIQPKDDLTPDTSPTYTD